MLSSIPNSFHAAMMSRHDNTLKMAMERLSTGTQLNHSWEDPGRFAMAENVHRQSVAADDVSAVIQDAINVLNVGQDGVQGISDVIQELRETLVRAANGTNTDENLDTMQQQLDTTKGLLLQAFSAAKNFRLRLDGSQADRVLHFQVGTNAGEVVSVDYNPLRDALRELIMGAYGYEELYNDPDGRGFLEGVGIVPPPAPNTPIPPIPLPGLPTGLPPGATFADAFPKKLLVNPNDIDTLNTSFALIDTARSKVTAQESYLGIVANRLEEHLSIMQQFKVDMGNSESALRDADMAKESTVMTRAQVLGQSAQAMLAQANARSNQVLDLLRQ